MDIVLVEDEDRFRLLLTQLLAGDGYTVRSAANAAQAVVLARDSLPECFVIDLGLPDIGGCALARYLREQYGAKPVLIGVTGNVSAEVRPVAEEAGFNQLLFKPFELASLESVLTAARRH